MGRWRPLLGWPLAVAAALALFTACSDPKMDASMPAQRAMAGLAQQPVKDLGDGASDPSAVVDAFRSLGFRGRGRGFNQGGGHLGRHAACGP